MAVNLTKNKALPLGIDLGSASIKIAQLRALPKGAFSLIAMGETPVPPEARREPSARLRFLHDGLRQILHSAPFKGAQCVLSLPAEMTFVQHLKVPKMPAEQLGPALRWELQGKLPYDPARAIVRHVVAGEILADGEAKQELIVMAVNRDTIESHINLLKRAKLDCVGMNIECCAIVDCFARLFRRTADGVRSILFVDIGAASTQVVIGHGSVVAFARNLVLAGGQLDQVVADALKVPLDEAHRLRTATAASAEQGPQAAQVAAAQAPMIEALGEQITSCLRYHDSVFPNRPLERAVFLGGQAYDKRLCQALARQIALPAQIGDPLACIPREQDPTAGPANGEANLPEWAVAVGLSIGLAVAAENAQRKEEVVHV
jgi:type IV pilus assembly protein PilM